MTKYNFQGWLNQKISDDSEVILAGKLEYLRLYLTDAMRELRNKVGLTQAQLAENLGVQQAAVSKLESPLKNHDFESVLDYLHTLDADLLVGVKHGEDIYQVSDNDGVMLVDIPADVVQLASHQGMSLREYVYAAIKQFSQKANSVIEVMTAFLESDDLIAAKVRERLSGRSPLELATDLEKCWNISDEDDQLRKVKNILDCPRTFDGSTRDGSDDDDDHDEIELLDLAESLIEKLAKIFNITGYC